MTMLNRSAAVASPGGRLLSSRSPLSPLSPGFNGSEARRAMRGKATMTPSVNVAVASPSPPTTAVALGFDPTIMERLESALASPFSPKTFLHTFVPSTPLTVSSGRYKSNTDHKNGPARVVSLKPRKKRAPQPLPLNQPSRLSEESPLSPFRYPSFVEIKAAVAPISPSAVLSKLSPVPNLTALSDEEIRRQKMEKLARCLGESGPQKMVFPSFGQVGQEVQGVNTYLDLYRQHSATVNSAMLATVKSPAPGDSRINWTTMDDVAKDSNVASSTKRKSVLRRSRSVGDFYSVEEVLKMCQVNVDPIQSIMPPDEEGMLSALPSVHPFASPVNKPVEYEDSQEIVDVELCRKRSIAKAKASILGDDAKRMQEFRTAFQPRPLDLCLGWDDPLPSPPQPSALEVRSPRAPYWVKPVMGPKTPRTLRTEKRQGWGGKWDFVGANMRLKEVAL